MNSDAKPERNVPRTGSGRVRRRLLRPLLALAGGGLIGLGVPSWKRQGDAPAPAAVGRPETEAAPAAVSPAAPAPLDAAKVRAEARAWFAAGSRKAQQSDPQKPPQELIDRIEALTSAELREWLEEGRSGANKYAPMDMLMERWWEIDPMAFAQWIGFLAQQPRPKMKAPVFVSWSSSMSLPDTNPPGYSSACRMLQRLDPKAKPPVPPAPEPALNQVKYTPPFVPPDEPAAETRPDFTAISAGEAARWLAGNSGQMQDLTQAAEKIARNDVRAALEWAKGIPRHLRERRNALSAVLSKGAGDAAWVLENVHLLEHREDMDYRLSYCGAKPEEVLEWMLGRTDPDERTAALNALTHRLLYRDPNAAVAMLARLTDPVERSAYLEAMLAKCQDDKGWEKLLPLVAAEPDGGKESMGAGVAAGILAKKKSVKEAIVWAETLPEDTRQESAMAAAFSVWARSDNAAAVQAAMQLPSGAARTEVLASLAVIRGERFPGEALKWSQTLAVEERVRILTQLAGSLAQHHAEEAREESAHLLASLPGAAGDERFQKAMWTLVPRVDTPSGQTAAMKWIDGVPSGKLHDDLVDYMKQEAGRIETVKAWLERQGQGQGQ